MTELLQDDEKLAYIKNNRSFIDTDGITHIVKLLGEEKEGKKNFYKIKILTDDVGTQINPKYTMNVEGDVFVDQKMFHSLNNNYFYHFVDKNNIKNETNNSVIAQGFVIKSKKDKPLSTTSSSGFGSGIFGIYFDDQSQLNSYLGSLKHKFNIFKISLKNPYIIQDKSHSDSITTASLQTNRYLEKLITNIIQNPEIDPSDLIEINSFNNLHILWNIALYRTEDNIDHDSLKEIFINYIEKYFEEELYDSKTYEPLYFLPINDIMNYLNYDGMLLSIPNWDRQCISFDYSNAGQLQGSNARLKYISINA